MRQYVKRHPLVAFFTLTIAIRWGAYVLPVLVDSLASAQDSGYAIPLLDYIVLVAPSIAGIAVAWAMGGIDGLKKLLVEIRKWRAGLRWYLFVLVGVPVLLCSAYGFVSLFTGPTLRPFDPGAWYLWPLLLLTVLFSAPVFEELFGWRGFALPELLERFDDLSASLILGFAWWVYHLDPSLWFAPHGLFAGPRFFVYGLGLIAYSVLMTWVYRGSGSLLLAGVGMHFAYNSSGLFLLPVNPPTGATTSPYIMGAAICLVPLAFVVVAVYGTKRFSPEPPEEKTPSPASQ